jgi:L-alanine-DL-glutamate epimerase-like enolase superfamily enzyme
MQSLSDRSRSQHHGHAPLFLDGPGLLAAIHVTSAMGTPDSMIEWRRFDLEAQIYDGALTPKSGRISVPQSPGLGLEPDPNVIQKYLRV